MSLLSDLGKSYYDLDSEIKSLSKQLDDKKAKRKELLEELIEEMQEEDLHEFAVDGINKRFSIKKDIFANYKAEDKEEVFDAFRMLGYEGIIKEDINARTLNSTIKDLTEDGTVELPPELADIISIYEKANISITTKR